MWRKKVQSSRASREGEGIGQGNTDRLSSLVLGVLTVSVLPWIAGSFPHISIPRAGDDVFFSYVNVLHLLLMEGSQTLGSTWEFLELKMHQGQVFPKLHLISKSTLKQGERDKSIKVFCHYIYKNKFSNIFQVPFSFSQLSSIAMHTAFR